MVTIVNRPKPKGADPAAVAAHIEATSHVVEQYNNFDVVWAKMGGFPWWPGVLFHSWEAVDAANFQLKERPVIPAPEKRDGGVVIYHCLIVFLDQFNCATLEISPATLCAFETNYARLSTEKKALKAKGFKTALQRAERMLHMSDHLTEAELAVLSAPPPRQLEKRRRIESGAEFVEIDMADDEIFEPEDEDMDDDYVQEVPSSRRKPATKATKRAAASVKRSTTKPRKPARSSRYFRGVESIETPDDELGAHDTDEDYVEHVPKSAKSKRQPKAAPKATLARKKASRKETSGAVVEISDGDDSLDEVTFSIAKSESKQKPARTPKTKAKPKGKSQLKHEALDDSDFDEHMTIKSKKSTSRPKSGNKGTRVKREECITDQADSVNDQSKPPIKNTPLASIWTTREESVGSDTPSESKGDLAYKLDLLWDSKLFTAETKSSDDFDVLRITKEGKEDEGGVAAAVTGRGERGANKRQMRSVQQSQIRQSLLQGNLDPHTMVQCEAYAPRDISVKKETAVVDEPSGASTAIVPSGRTRGMTTPTQAPFDVQVHPDAVFVCDLHAHLATCEIIGFLGGRWDEASRTLYIQAAFPCRSLVIDGDDGSTDVEMDPESEIELREIIQNAKLEVVGWYHSHPAFAPDPSIRDIENQTSYQQLFQRASTATSTEEKVKTESTPSVWEPFVGLIVGTYDTRRDTPVSLFRYFHVRGERVSSAVRREVFMPYELVPSRPRYRSVLEDERRSLLRSLSMYPSVYKCFFGNSVVKMKAPSWPFDNVQTKAEDASLHISPKIPPASRKRKVRAGSVHEVSDGAAETTPVKKTKGGRKRPAPRKGARNGGRKGSISVDTVDTEMIDLSVDADCEMEKVDVIDVVSESSQSQTVIEIESSQSQEQNSSQHSIDSSTGSQPTLVIINTKRKNGDSKDRTRTSESQMIHDILAVVTSEGTRDEAIDSKRGKKQNAPRRVSIEDRTATQPSNNKFANLRCETKDLELPVGEVIMVSSSSSQSDNSGFVASSQSQTDSFVASSSSPPTQDDDPYAGIFVISGTDSANGFGNDVTSGNAVYQFATSSIVTKTDGDDEKDSSLNQSSQGTMIDDVNANDDSLIAESLYSQSASQDIDEADHKRKAKVEDEDITVISKVEEEERSAGKRRQNPDDAACGALTSSLPHENRTGKASIPRKSSSTTSHCEGAPRRSPTNASEASDEGSSDKAVDIRDDESIASVASSGDGASQSTGRKRNRKPTSTSRVSADHRVSMSSSQPGKSPRSPHSARDVGFGGFNTHELSFRDKFDESKRTPLVSVEKSTQDRDSLSDWGGVEIIHTDIMELSAPTKIHSSDSAPAKHRSDHAKQEDDEKVKKIESTSPSDSASFDQSNLPQSIPNMKVETPTTDDSPRMAPEPAKCLNPNLCATTSNDKNLDELCSAGMDKSGVPTPTSMGISSDDTSDDVKMEVETDKKQHTDTESSSVSSGPTEDDHELVENMEVEPSEEADIQMEVATVVHHLVHEIEKNQSAANPTENGALSEPPRCSDSLVSATSNESLLAATPAAASPLEGVKMEVVASTPPSQEVTESVAETKSEVSRCPKRDAAQSSNLPSTQLFGANQECEDFRTSMQRIAHHFERVKEERDGVGGDKPISVSSVSPNGSSVPATIDSTDCKADKLYLESLRTRYGPGIKGCAEQVITLVDYYRDFERRTDLNEMWKPRITKLQKMEASLRANVRFVNVPVHLRDAFVDDLIGYIRTTWGLVERRR
ncbi:hypothetical protein PINS_up015141 [Pythium insidiosum]|nr:hypothetical protein PINS_up015141 [Pythium insidiosum]